MLFNIFIILLLMALAGTMAGLTLALFSLKISTLERKVRMGEPYAETVLKIREKSNLLLCTLLLGNVASYTAMTVFLDSLTTSVITGLVATALIFIFGEILPQAIFPRYALLIGAKLSWLVWVLIVLFYPVSAPIAWLLDKMLGKEPPVLWSKEELGEIIKYHEDLGNGIIDEDEERIILGALTFSEMKVADIMIPQKDVFYLDAKTVIDERILKEIKAKGFSRIPVYDTDAQKVVGVLNAKSLIGAVPALKAVQLCSTTHLIKVDQSMMLDNLLSLLIHRKSHLALVVDKSDHLVGVVTLEDIMEEILKTEIDDKN
jgi:metal transporter CNNM